MLLESIIEETLNDYPLDLSLSLPYPAHSAARQRVPGIVFPHANSQPVTSVL